MNLQTSEDKLKNGNVMSSPVVTVIPDMYLGEAMQIMVSKRIGNLAIIDGEKVLGLLTEKELLQYLALNKSIPNKQLRYILPQKFVKVTPNTSVFEAARIMISKKARMPVFNNKTRQITINHLAGIITASDMLKAFLKIGKNYNNPSIDHSMTNKVSEVRPGGTILSAIKLMLKNRIGSVIVKSGESPYSIFLEKDLLSRVSSEHIDIEEKVGGCCSYSVMSTRMGIEARDAGKIMVKNKIKRLPLVENDDDRIVAMVTATNLVEAY